MHMEPLVIFSKEMDNIFEYYFDVKNVKRKRGR